jgi:hypothetical protein
MKPEPVGTAPGNPDSPLAVATRPRPFSRLSLNENLLTPGVSETHAISGLTNDGLVSTSQEDQVPLKCPPCIRFFSPTDVCMSGGQRIAPQFFLIKRQSRCTTNQRKQE